MTTSPYTAKVSVNLRTGSCRTSHLLDRAALHPKTLRNPRRCPLTLIVMRARTRRVQTNKTNYMSDEGPCRSQRSLGGRSDLRARRKPRVTCKSNSPRWSQCPSLISSGRHAARTPAANEVKRNAWSLGCGGKSLAVTDQGHGNPL